MTKTYVPRNLAAALATALLAAAASTAAVPSAAAAPRTDSRIVSLKISPQPVAKGRTLTVTGELQHRTSAWRSYGGQRVAVLFQPLGSSTWTTVTTAGTNSTGHFTAGSKASQDGTWVVGYAGDGTHFASRSAQDYVDVH
ncbi:hypothetical protein ACH4UM_33495 [Streptomyces sp. NPDC020801]|uniref:hypothetical protein n=1 Tax=unclassified Streptomyces TaxID=2593676 RepID=UPI0037878E6F